MLTKNSREYDDESRRLGRLFRSGNRQAGLDLLNLHLPLAYYIAERYAKVDSDRDNTRQNARIGLWTAITHYDPDRKNSFSTYAVYWIRHCIISELRTHGPVHVPPYVVTTFNEIHRFVKRYRLKFGTGPSQKTIAKKFSMSVDELEALQFAERSMSHLGHISLDDPARHQSLDDSDNCTLSAYFVGRALALRILSRHAALFILTKTERRILIARYGLFGQEEIPYRQMGKFYGCSRTSIQHIERMALHKLREHLKRTSPNGEEQHP